MALIQDTKYDKYLAGKYKRACTPLARNCKKLNIPIKIWPKKMILYLTEINNFFINDLFHE